MTALSARDRVVTSITVFINGVRQKTQMKATLRHRQNSAPRVIVTWVVAPRVTAATQEVLDDKPEFDAAAYVKSGERVQVALAMRGQQVVCLEMTVKKHVTKSAWRTGQTRMRVTFEEVPRPMPSPDANPPADA